MVQAAKNISVSETNRIVDMSPLKWAALSVAMVGMLALFYVPFPIGEDQALFLVIAREMAAGARMYGEFWDVKQPGIYWWYLAAGQIFGFTSVGVHLFETIWAILLSGIVACVAWSVRRGALSTALAPLTCLGTFYAVSSLFDWSQIEVLVALPLGGIVACLAKDGATNAQTSARYLLAGAMLTAVVLFKQMIALVAVGIVGVTILDAKRSDKETWGNVFRHRLLPTIIGCGTTTSIVGLVMLVQGTLSQALWTTFVYPPKSLIEYSFLEHFQAGRFRNSFAWFMRCTAPLLPWAIWACVSRPLRRSRVVWMCGIWIVTALMVIALQKLSWWSYHFCILFVPVGLLAALGLSDVCERLFRHQPVSAPKRATALLAVSLTLGACIGYRIIPKVAQFGPIWVRSFTEPQILRQGINNVAWSKLTEAASALQRELQSSPSNQPSQRMIVWSDYRLYLLTGRRPVVEVDGSTRYLTEQISPLIQIIRDRKIEFMFITNSKLRIGTDSLKELAKERYVPFYDGPWGTWYRLRRELRD